MCLPMIETRTETTGHQKEKEKETMIVELEVEIPIQETDVIIGEIMIIGENAIVTLTVIATVIDETGATSVDVTLVVRRESDKIENGMDIGIENEIMIDMIESDKMKKESEKDYPRNQYQAL